jgi:hypothetical protein
VVALVFWLFESDPYFWSSLVDSVEGWM